MKPAFIGIGAQKCATSWVYRVLEDHPQAVLSEPKELHFFSSYFDRGYQWYERHFPERDTKTVAGEFSTTYLYNAEAAIRAREYNPDFRIIVSLRDPVARAYSNHLHEVRAGHVTAIDRSYEACEADNPMYLQQSRYAEQLKKWLRCFSAEQIVVLFQEEISADPGLQAGRLYRFLGLDDGHTSSYLHERVNPSAIDRSGTARLALRGAATALRAVAGDRFVRDLRTKSMVKFLRQTNKQDLAKLIAPMKPATEVRLRKLLAEDMQELASLLGRAELPWRSWRLLTTE